MKKNKEIIYSQHIGIHSINPFAINNSSPRNVMFSGHLGQRLVIEGCDEEIVQTGVSREYGKYTFAVRMPADGTIINIIQKYPQSVSKNTLSFNPETIIIYENYETKEIDYISIPYHNTLHQYFGYKYNINEEAMSMIRHGANIPKGTVFADSPSIAENGGYKLGVNLNTVFMSHPAVAEDGIAIARDVAEKLRFRVYDTRIVEFGSNNFPLNLYGDLDNYKPFPEIGDYIRDDGILMMLRDYDLDTVPVNFHPYSTMEPDMMFDAATYVRGSGGRIVDIEVIGNNNSNKNLPEQMRGQINRYQKAYIRFCQEIINTDQKIRQTRKKSYGLNSVKLSHRFHRLVTDCLAIVNHNENKYDQKLTLQYKRSSLDEYRIKFVIENIIVPDYGYKLTDYEGGKAF